MVWMYIGIALGGFWIGNLLTSTFYVIGYGTSDFDSADAFADKVRYISAFLAAIFIGIGIVW